MEIMRLAICDDSTEIVEQIESYIDKIQEMHIEYEVFFSGEELYRYKKNEEVEFDIYLLDIEMKQMSIVVQLSRHKFNLFIMNRYM